MYYLIYQTTNLINNKIYIGKHETNNLNDDYLGSGTYLNNAIKKYGVKNFNREILFQFDNKIEMFDKEKELVNEDFVKRADTYNLKTGGIGSWSHINDDPIKRKEVSALSSKANKGNNGSSYWSEETRKIVTERFRKLAYLNHPILHSEEANTKRKTTIEKNKPFDGKKNSQFGRYWISNPVSKEVKRVKSIEEFEEYISTGWVRGKKGKIITTCWMVLNNTEYIVNITEQDKYLKLGYTKGRLPEHSGKKI